MIGALPENNYKVLNAVYGNGIFNREAGNLKTNSSIRKFKSIHSLEDLNKKLISNPNENKYGCYTSNYSFKIDIGEWKKEHGKKATFPYNDLVIIDNIFLDFDLSKDDIIHEETGLGYTEINKLDTIEYDNILKEIKDKDKANTINKTDKEIQEYYINKYENNYLSKPINEAKKLATTLKKLSNVDCILNLSGGKGCHLRILFNEPVSLNYPNDTIKDVFTEFRDKLKLETLDPAVITSAIHRPSRIICTQHQKTKLYANPFLVDSSYLEILDNAENNETCIIPDINTKNNIEFVNWLKQQDERITFDKKNNNTRYDYFISKYSVKDKKYNDLTIQFLKIYKQGQMNEIGYRLIHCLRRSNWSKKEVKTFFKELPVNQNMSEVYKWIDRAYNINPNNPDETAKLVGLPMLIEGINTYATNKDKADLIKFFNDYFKIQKVKKEDLPPQLMQDFLFKDIAETLNRNSEPSAKKLADYLNSTGAFFLDFNTRKRYIKSDEGFNEISIDNISEFFNNKFGDNQISLKRCGAVFDFISKKIQVNYNLIVFNNGTLNTETEVFEPDTFYPDVLAKATLPFNYIANAEEEYLSSDLFKEFHEILKNKRWSWNENLYYKVIGSTLTATNEIGKLITVVGKPFARKTTLLVPLERAFNCSYVKLYTLANPNDFDLYDIIRHPINIDDDLQGTMISSIGLLNSLVTGGNVHTQIKHDREGADLDMYSTPRLVNASNRLPPILGDGFERRNLLILAENDFSKAESNPKYQIDMRRGFRDAELSLMFSYSFQKYCSTRDDPITTEKMDSIMLEEWTWKSYPAKKGAELLFCDEDIILDQLYKNDNVLNDTIETDKWFIKYEIFINDGKDTAIKIINTYTTVKEVNKQFKRFYKYCLENNKIFKEQSKPNPTQIKKAMNNAGFEQTGRYYTKDNGSRSSERVYENCIINKDWVNLLNGSH